jgi:class 3 adenylate cyclase
VISFAGDALICVFRDHPDLPCDSKRKAVECACKLKEHCTDQLSAHIALTTGEMCFGLLGGYMNNWVYLLNGKCIHELSQCIDDAQTKQLVVSQSFSAHIPDDYRQSLSLTVLSSGNILITEVMKESINPMEQELCYADRFELSSTTNPSYTVGILGFLPTTVVSSMSAGSFKNISELRIVTTMFLKLDSYSSQENNDLTTLQPFLAMAQEAIFLTGGVLRQFLVDDKGCVLIALWGVPSASYANNTYRAVVCGTTIFDKAQRMGHATSIGITTGQCFCGTIGSILRRDYVAIGDSVNMAARLMGKAHGRILVDETTHGSLPAMIRGVMTEGEPLMLKGRDTPLTPFTFKMTDEEGQEKGEESNGGGQEKKPPSCMINLSTVSMNSFSTMSLSSLSTSSLSATSTDDSVFMTPSHPKASRRFSSTRPKQSQLASSISEHDPPDPVTYGEQFDDISESDENIGMTMRSNLTPEIELTLKTHMKQLVQLQRNIMRHRQTPIQSSRHRSEHHPHHHHAFQHQHSLTSDTSSHPRCHLSSSQPFPLMKYVVVHGKQGTGKTEVAKYFRKISLQNKVRCFYIKAVDDDLSLEYGVFRRLFLTLIGSNAFNTLHEEQRALISILKVTYPMVPNKVIIKWIFPVLKDVLGLHWDLDVGANSGSLVGVPEQKSVMRSYQCYFTKYRSNTVMSEIIRSLLMNIPSTIIIDDAHYCDTLTWRELSFLTSADLPLVCLLTMRPPLISHGDIQQAMIARSSHTTPTHTATNPNPLVESTPHSAMSKYGSMIRRFFRSENRIHPSQSPHKVAQEQEQEQTLRHVAGTQKYIPQSSAASVCRHLVTSNPNGTLLTLEQLTRSQVSNILCCVLSRTEVVSDLIEIILEVSAGNAYWVRAIADYVLQFGYESFMKSVGVTMTTTPKQQSHTSHQQHHVTEDSHRSESEDSTEPSSRSRHSPSPSYAISSSYRKHGGLSHVNNSFQKKSDSSSSSPTSPLEHESSHLRTFLVSLVDQLSTQDSTVLKFASLIGVTFCSNILQQILPQSYHKPGLLASSLLSLEERGFVIRLTSEGTLYHFQNHRLREIVYDFTPPR